MNWAGDASEKSKRVTELQEGIGCVETPRSEHSRSHQSNDTQVFSKHGQMRSGDEFRLHEDNLQLVKTSSNHSAINSCLGDEMESIDERVGVVEDKPGRGNEESPKTSQTPVASVPIGPAAGVPCSSENHQSMDASSVTLQKETDLCTDAERCEVSKLPHVEQDTNGGMTQPSNSSGHVAVEARHVVTPELSSCSLDPIQEQRSTGTMPDNTHLEQVTYDGGGLTPSGKSNLDTQVSIQAGMADMPGHEIEQEAIGEVDSCMDRKHCGAMAEEAKLGSPIDQKPGGTTTHVRPITSDGTHKAYPIFQKPPSNITPRHADIRPEESGTTPTEEVVWKETQADPPRKHTVEDWSEHTGFSISAKSARQNSDTGQNFSKNSQPLGTVSQHAELSRNALDRDKQDAPVTREGCDGVLAQLHIKINQLKVIPEDLATEQSVDTDGGDEQEAYKVTLDQAVAESYPETHEEHFREIEEAVTDQVVPVEEKETRPVNCQGPSPELEAGHQEMQGTVSRVSEQGTPQQQVPEHSQSSLNKVDAASQNIPPYQDSIASTPPTSRDTTSKNVEEQLCGPGLERTTEGKRGVETGGGCERKLVMEGQEEMTPAQLRESFGEIFEQILTGQNGLYLASDGDELSASQQAVIDEVLAHEDPLYSPYTLTTNNKDSHQHLTAREGHTPGVHDTLLDSQETISSELPTQTCTRPHQPNTSHQETVLTSQRVVSINGYHGNSQASSQLSTDDVMIVDNSDLESNNTASPLPLFNLRMLTGSQVKREAPSTADEDFSSPVIPCLDTRCWRSPSLPVQRHSQRNTSQGVTDEEVGRLVNDGDDIQVSDILVPLCPPLTDPRSTPQITSTSTNTSTSTSKFRPPYKRSWADAASCWYDSAFTEDTLGPSKQAKSAAPAIILRLTKDGAECSQWRSDVAPSGDERRILDDSERVDMGETEDVGDSQRPLVDGTGDVQRPLAAELLEAVSPVTGLQTSEHQPDTQPSTPPELTVNLDFDDGDSDPTRTPGTQALLSQIVQKFDDPRHPPTPDFNLLESSPESPPRVFAGWGSTPSSAGRVSGSGQRRVIVNSIGKDLSLLGYYGRKKRAPNSPACSPRLTRSRTRSKDPNEPDSHSEDGRSEMSESILTPPGARRVDKTLLQTTGESGERVSPAVGVHSAVPRVTKPGCNPLPRSLRTCTKSLAPRHTPRARPGPAVSSPCVRVGPAFSSPATRPLPAPAHAAHTHSVQRRSPRIHALLGASCSPRSQEPASGHQPVTPARPAAADTRNYKSPSPAVARKQGKEEVMEHEKEVALMNQIERKQAKVKARLEGAHVDIASLEKVLMDGQASLSGLNMAHKRQHQSLGDLYRAGAHCGGQRGELKEQILLLSSRQKRLLTLFHTQRTLMDQLKVVKQTGSNTQEDVKPVICLLPQTTDPPNASTTGSPQPATTPIQASVVIKGVELVDDPETSVARKHSEVHRVNTGMINLQRPPTTKSWQTPVCGTSQVSSQQSTTSKGAPKSLSHSLTTISISHSDSRIRNNVPMGLNSCNSKVISSCLQLSPVVQADMGQSRGCVDSPAMSLTHSVSSPAGLLHLLSSPSMRQIDNISSSPDITVISLEPQSQEPSKPATTTSLSCGNIEQNNRVTLPTTSSDVASGQLEVISTMAQPASSVLIDLTDCVSVVSSGVVTTSLPLPASTEGVGQHLKAGVTLQSGSASTVVSRVAAQTVRACTPQTVLVRAITAPSGASVLSSGGSTQPRLPPPTTKTTASIVRPTSMSLPPWMSSVLGPRLPPGVLAHATSAAQSPRVGHNTQIHQMPTVTKPAVFSHSVAGTGSSSRQPYNPAPITACGKSSSTGREGVITMTTASCQPVSGSEMYESITPRWPDLRDLIQLGLIAPGRDVLTLYSQTETYYASLTERGLLVDSRTQTVYQRPTLWCKALHQVNPHLHLLSGALVKKKTAYQRVHYKGTPLCTFRPTITAVQPLTQHPVGLPNVFGEVVSGVAVDVEPSVEAPPSGMLGAVSRMMQRCDTVRLITEEEIIGQDPWLPPNFWSANFHALQLTQHFLQDIDRW